MPSSPSESLSAQLAPIRARADAATPGPWRALTTGRAGGDHWQVCDQDQSVALIHASDGEDEERREPDAAFIAAARTDVPALLAIIDRLTDALDVAETTIEDANHEVNGLLDSMDESVIADEAERLAVYDAILNVWQEIGADYDAAKESLK